METMEKIMTNPGLYLIRDKISGYLSHEDLEICCEVNPNWNRSLKRQSLIKYLLEFGNKHVESSKRVEEWKKVHEVIPGWSKAVKKIAIKASIDDLKEIKDSLSFLVGQLDRLDQDGNLSCPGCPELVFSAALFGDWKLMELLFETSYDMNSLDDESANVFITACYGESTEMVELIIRSSKDHGINLNLRDYSGQNAFQIACQHGSLEILKLLLENYKELGIDIMHQDYKDETALDMLKWRMKLRLKLRLKFRLELYKELKEVKEWEEFKTALEKEYAKIDSLEHVAKKSKIQE